MFVCMFLFSFGVAGVFFPRILGLIFGFGFGLSFELGWVGLADSTFGFDLGLFLGCWELGMEMGMGMGMGMSEELRMDG